MKDRSEVLILCKGNICRSPYAQKRLQKLLSEQSIDIEVRSAGLETNNGKPADPSAVNQALLRGLDLSSHKTKPVTIEDIERASAIFVMTPDQKRQVLKRATITKDKTYLLGEFAVSKGYQVSIPDPFGKADILFENCFKHIDAALGEIVQELVQKRNEKPRE